MKNFLNSLITKAIKMNPFIQIMLSSAAFFPLPLLLKNSFAQRPDIISNIFTAVLGFEAYAFATIVALSATIFISMKILGIKPVEEDDRHFLEAPCLSDNTQLVGLIALQTSISLEESEEQLFKRTTAHNKKLAL